MTVFFSGPLKSYSQASADCLSGGPYGNNRHTRKSALRAENCIFPSQNIQLHWIILLSFCEIARCHYAFGPRNLLRYHSSDICCKMCTNCVGHIQSVYNVYNRYTMVLGPPWRPRDRVYTMYRPPEGHMRSPPCKSAWRNRCVAEFL